MPYSRTDIERMIAGKNHYRAGVLMNVVEDLQSGALAVDALRSRGLPQLRVLLDSKDFKRVSQVLRQDANADRVASLIETAIKVGAGAAAGAEAGRRAGRGSLFD